MNGSLRSLPLLAALFLAVGTPATPVEAQTEIRKTPVDTGLQRVVTHKLEVSPGANLRSYHDYFGSHVHYFNLLEPHDGAEPGMQVK